MTERLPMVHRRIPHTLDVDVTAKTMEDATTEANQIAADYYGNTPHRLVDHHATVTARTYSNPASWYRVRFEYEAEEDA